MRVQTRPRSAGARVRRDGGHHPSRSMCFSRHRMESICVIVGLTRSVLTFPLAWHELVANVPMPIER